MQISSRKNEISTEKLAINTFTCPI